MTDKMKKTARPVVTMVNGEHDHGLLDLMRRADRRSIMLSFPFPAVGSIVTSGLLTPAAASDGDGLFQVAEVLARGLGSALGVLVFHRSSRVDVDASSCSSFGAPKCLISLLCTASVVQGSSTRSSMGGPDGLLSIGTTLDTPHPRTSDVRALPARRIKIGGGVVQEWGRGNLLRMQLIHGLENE